MTTLVIQYINRTGEKTLFYWFVLLFIRVNELRKIIFIPFRPTIHEIIIMSLKVNNKLPKRLFIFYLWN